jgi:DNA-binding NtrC family response regulator
LVLTDLIMPNMGGQALGSELKGLSPELKIIYMSDYLDGAILPREELGSGSAFLQKPIEPESVLRKVHRLLHANGESRLAAK